MVNVKAVSSLLSTKHSFEVIYSDLIIHSQSLGLTLRQGPTSLLLLFMGEMLKEKKRKKD